MGRLRDDYEFPLMCNTSEEVVDLFGVDDAYLFRFSAADNNTIKDPLWDEPMVTGGAAYRKFKIKCMFLEYDNTTDASEEGSEAYSNNEIYVSRNHLLKAQVPPDVDGELVSEGDSIGIHYKGDYIEYDITDADHDGYLNNSDKFSGYRLTVVRREKFIPERKTQSGTGDLE